MWCGFLGDAAIFLSSSWCATRDLRNRPPQQPEFLSFVVYFFLFELTADRCRGIKPLTTNPDVSKPTIKTIQLENWIKSWHWNQVKSQHGRGRDTPTQDYIHVILNVGYSKCRLVHSLSNAVIIKSWVRGKNLDSDDVLSLESRSKKNPFLDILVVYFVYWQDCELPLAHIYLLSDYHLLMYKLFYIYQTY